MAELADYYDRNVALIRDYRPELEACVQDIIPDEIRPLATRSGEITITCRGSLVHSRYNPVKEGRDFVKATGIEAGDNVICYGLGLGYHIEAILDAIGPDYRCCVIELNKSLLTAAMILRDLSRLIKAENLVFITGDDEPVVAEKCIALFSDIDDKSSGARTKVVIHSASFQSIPKGFDTIQNIFEVMLMERSVPQIFRKQSIENLLRNLDDVLAWPGIDQVFSEMRGQPAFIVSAGPSLDDAIPHLSSLQDKAWIFTVDTAMSALLDASIRPDFVTVVDPQEASLEHFRGYLDTDIPLIFIPTASAAVIEKYKGPRITAIQSEHSIVSKIEHLLAYKGTIAAGGSTACITLGIVVKYGFDPIIFVGQDCGFPDMKVYSSNVMWTRRMLSTLNRFSTLEMGHRSMAETQKLVTVKDKFGHDVPTHQNLYSYLRELERIIDANPEVEFYNFFSRGASINGARELHFTEEAASMLELRLDKAIEIRRSSIDEHVKPEIIRIISDLR
jgi:hypothetical protein